MIDAVTIVDSSECCPTVVVLGVALLELNVAMADERWIVYRARGRRAGQTTTWRRWSCSGATSLTSGFNVDRQDLCTALLCRRAASAVAPPVVLTGSPVKKLVAPSPTSSTSVGQMEPSRSPS
jgi:hypothetical protein